MAVFPDSLGTGCDNLQTRGQGGNQKYPPLPIAGQRAYRGAWSSRNEVTIVRAVRAPPLPWLRARRQMRLTLSQRTTSASTRAPVGDARFAPEAASPAGSP